ncbi:MAG: multifunctional CCA addition/repair protein [Pseudomonadota bacterium]
MRIYTVGGAVRDQLLGRPVHDRDYVVVGASPEQMVAAGFRPVGKDFPVFLHPRTQEEYALARTERKSAPGYRGFVIHAAPDVTLEQDLVRRDLTINAIAMAEDGSLRDPFGGVADLARRLFRHVSAAFAEDPVRILRLARFAARYADFSVAPDTMALMRDMVAAGEVDHLVPERVWQEVARGLGEARPARMLAVLRDCGALARIMPELDAAWQTPGARGPAGAHLMRALDHAAERGAELAVRFSVLALGLGAGDGEGEGEREREPALASIASLCRRLKVPNDCRELAAITVREHHHVGAVPALPAEAVVALLERCDAWRKPQRFAHMLEALVCHALGGWQDQARHLLAALAAARAVNAGEVARRCAGHGASIPAAVHAARVEAVEAAWGDLPGPHGSANGA